MPRARVLFDCRVMRTTCRRDLTGRTSVDADESRRSAGRAKLERKDAHPSIGDERSEDRVARFFLSRRRGARIVDEAPDARAIDPRPERRILADPAIDRRRERALQPPRLRGLEAELRPALGDRFGEYAVEAAAEGH